MKFYNLVSIFFNEIIANKRNAHSENSEKSYVIMRYLYKFSDGIFLYLILKFFNFKNKSSFSFRKSFDFFPKLNQKIVSQLKDEIFNMKVSNDLIKFDKIKIKNSIQKEIDFSYYKKKNLMRLDIESEDLLKNRLISEIATSDYLLNKMEKILGTKPQLLGIDSWITLPAPIQPKSYDEIGKIVSSQMWHRDCDNLRDIKLMIYLTDVINENEGPFEIIKGTNSFSFFNPLKYEMGSVGLRISDDYIKKKYSKKIHSFYGVAGTSFITDTRAIHRGKTIEKNNHFRLLLQLYFSNSSFGKKRKKFKIYQDWESFMIWNSVLKKKDNFNCLLKI